MSVCMYTRKAHLNALSNYDESLVHTSLVTLTVGNCREKHLRARGPCRHGNFLSSRTPHLVVNSTSPRAILVESSVITRSDENYRNWVIVHKEENSCTVVDARREVGRSNVWEIQSRFPLLIFAPLGTAEEEFEELILRSHIIQSADPPPKHLELSN